MADELLQNYAEDIASLSLIPGHKGVFRVSLDGETRFDKEVLGRFPEPAEVIEAVFEALDAR